MPRTHGLPNERPAVAFNLLENTVIYGFGAPMKPLHLPVRYKAGTFTTMHARYTSIALTAALFISDPAAHAQWQPVGIPAFSAGMVDYPVMAIGTDNAPCMVFSDWTSASKLTAMKYNGSSWQILGNAGFSAGGVMDPTLAINAAGTPYVAYRDMANSLKITVMKLSGSSWEVVGSTGPSSAGGAKPSLAFGPGDVPYVAFADNSFSNNVTVKKFEGGSWIPVGAEGYSPIYAAQIALAFNSTGVPYVAYHGNSAGCRVERFVNGAWELVGSLANLYDARITDLCISPDDVPYIVYNDVGDDFHAKVKKMDGGDWTLVGTAVSSGDENPEELSMAMDGAGAIYVAYTDTDLGIRSTVKKFSTGSWQAVGNMGFTEPMSNSLSLALDQAGTPYVGFKDAANNAFKTTVMRYEDGTSGIASEGSAMSSILMAPNPAQDRTELWGLPSGAVITLFDLLGNQVALPIRATNRATLSTGHLADGLYLVKVQSQGHSRSLRLNIAR